MSKQNQLLLLKTVVLKCISWKDTIELYSPIEGFDHIKVESMKYTTASTNNESMAFAITNLNGALVGSQQNLDGDQVLEHTWYTILDKRPDVTVFRENILDPIPVQNKSVYKQLKYEIYIDNALADSDISASNPVFIELSFFRSV